MTLSWASHDQLPESCRQAQARQAAIGRFFRLSLKARPPRLGPQLKRKISGDLGLPSYRALARRPERDQGVIRFRQSAVQADHKKVRSSPEALTLVDRSGSTKAVDPRVREGLAQRPQTLRPVPKVFLVQAIMGYEGLATAGKGPKINLSHLTPLP